MSSMFCEFCRRLDCRDSRSGTSNDARRWHVLVKLKRSHNPQLAIEPSSFSHRLGVVLTDRETGSKNPRLEFHRPFAEPVRILDCPDSGTTRTENLLLGGQHVQGQHRHGNSQVPAKQSKRRLSGPESQTSKQRTSLVIRAGSRYHYRTSTSENWWWALGLWISDGPQDQELLESNVVVQYFCVLGSSVGITNCVDEDGHLDDRLRHRVPAGARGRGDQEEGRSPQFTAPAGDSEPDSDSCTDQEMPAAGCPTATRRSSASPGTINCGALMDAYSASVSDIEPLDGDLVFLFCCSRGCRYYGDGGS
ncbi:hypothetical protein DFH06DRAFT_1124205 [Mycena polygramma]|nr:hypothetical protein DFH06DRAFT_1124205 [Mycena polygramma]